MSFLKLKKFGFMAAGVGLLAIVAIQGCSSDDTQATPGSGGKTNTAGSVGKAGSEPKGGESNNNNGGAAGKPDDTGSEAGESGEAGAAPVDPGCIGDDGCYSCTPETNDQFLNHCVEGGCPATFNNKTLSKIDLVGTL